MKTTSIEEDKELKTFFENHVTRIAMAFARWKREGGASWAPRRKSLPAPATEERTSEGLALDSTQDSLLKNSPAAPQ